jgi:hypothetical protein
VRLMPNRNQAGVTLHKSPRRLRVPPTGCSSSWIARIRRPSGRELSSGLPVPREPAYDAKRSQDGEAQAAFE